MASPTLPRALLTIQRHPATQSPRPRLLQRIRPQHSRPFHSTRVHNATPFLHLAALSQAKQTQHLLAKSGLSVVNHSPRLEAIRASEVDPFAGRSTGLGASDEKKGRVRGDEASVVEKASAARARGTSSGKAKTVGIQAPSLAGMTSELPQSGLPVSTISEHEWWKHASERSQPLPSPPGSSETTTRLARLEYKHIALDSLLEQTRNEVNELRQMQIPVAKRGGFGVAATGFIVGVGGTLLYSSMYGRSGPMSDRIDARPSETIDRSMLASPVSEGVAAAVHEIPVQTMHVATPAGDVEAEQVKSGFVMRTLLALMWADRGS